MSGTKLPAFVPLAGLVEEDDRHGVVIVVTSRGTQTMRILAIGDIHGCLHQFNDLLAAVKPTADDLVITLGDYVDRGADSRGVLERLIELRNGGMRLLCLRGN